MPEIKYSEKAVIVKVVEGTIYILLERYRVGHFLPDKLNGKYALPGGQADFNEGLTESCKREVEEETGVVIEPLFPLCSWTWVYKKGDYLKQIIALARVALYIRGEIIEPQKEGEVILEKAIWVDLLELKRLIAKNKIVIDEIPALNYFLDLVEEKLLDLLVVKYRKVKTIDSLMAI